jgi:hypothetical protein
MARLAWTASVSLLLGSAVARAEQEPAWLVHYDVAPGCADHDAFQQGVRRRVTRPLDVAFAELRLGVSITRAATLGSRSLVGKLDITDAAGLTSSRELHGSSCPQLLEALSLLAAVAADAAHAMNAAPLSTPGEQPAVNSAVSGRLAAEPPRDVGTRPYAPPEGFRAGPLLYAVLQNAATPDPELGFGAALSLDWPARGYWAPSLQVGAYRVQSRELSVGPAGIQARFELLAAHAVACPWRLPARGIWSLRPCLELDVGVLGGEGNGAALMRSADREGVWASSGLSLRAELSPWTPLSISTSIGAVLPWTRHEFYFAPDTEAFSVPRLGFRGTLAGALMF